MEYKKTRVFIDTSVVIAGTVSATGASAAILELCEAGIFEMVVSEQVIIEADRNFENKFPNLIDKYRMFIKNISPVVVDDPSPPEVRSWAKVINLKDAPILAAAMGENVNYLITLDTKHFHTERVKEKCSFKVVTPQEFLKEFQISMGLG